MKKVLTVSLAVMMIAGPAMAADHIGIFTDQTGAAGNCSMVPPAFSPFAVYLVHQTAGAVGSQFKVANSSGYNLSAQLPCCFIAQGDLFAEGISFSYLACLAGPSVVVAALNGFGFPVPGQVCGLVEVVAATGKPYTISVDCNLTEQPATGGRFVFNPDTTCPPCPPDATEESTWGKVKALYR